MCYHRLESNIMNHKLFMEIEAMKVRTSLGIIVTIDLIRISQLF